MKKARQSHGKRVYKASQFAWCTALYELPASRIQVIW